MKHIILILSLLSMKAFAQSAYNQAIEAQAANQRTLTALQGQLADLKTQQVVMENEASEALYKLNRDSQENTRQMKNAMEDAATEARIDSQRATISAQQAQMQADDNNSIAHKAAIDPIGYLHGKYK